ncbi:predicted protein [Uncinocarpus reesii 1704]|uniref:Uncharacterized protein n=1 Tax=Uncinocarpus reesii (strain UAMH 1704) TaxID=336963 RepID=C4JGP5_UNCRE|nr:uncharacterized protein UREG_02557 [Uncinocarpus reesii 1704]EEP77708.1 predicted protein [Uncinocarpus reesii 1704]
MEDPLSWILRECASTPIAYPRILPCVAELLRTGYHPPELILRVERVIEVPIILSRSRVDDDTCAPAAQYVLEASGDTEREQPVTHKSYRVFLSDGELLIQALLKRELHYFVSVGEVTPGAVLAIQSFEIRRAQRIAGPDNDESDKGKESGLVAFLDIIRFCVIDTGDQLDKRRYEAVERGVPIVKTVTVVDRKRPLDEQDGELLEIKKTKRSKLDSKPDLEIEQVAPPPLNVETAPPARDSFEDVLSDAEMLDSNSLLEVEREHSLPGAGTRSLTPKSNESTPQSPPIPRRSTLPEQAWPTAANPPPKGPRNHSRALSMTRNPNLLPIHTLFHPPRPLPRRNYIVDIFGVVSWISPTTIVRRNMPPKRDLRVVDASFTSHPYRNQHPNNDKLELGISVSVFVDAERFHPPIGTVALFQALKTHEWEGVSLNAYEKECGGGKEWFVCDQQKLEGSGYDFVGMRSWWEQWNKAREKQAEEKKQSEDRGTKKTP